MFSIVLTRYCKNIPQTGLQNSGRTLNASIYDLKLLVTSTGYTQTQKIVRLTALSSTVVSQRYRLTASRV